MLPSWDLLRCTVVLVLLMALGHQQHPLGLALSWSRRGCDHCCDLVTDVSLRHGYSHCLDMPSPSSPCPVAHLIEGYVASGQEG